MKSQYESKEKYFDCWNIQQMDGGYSECYLQEYTSDELEMDINKHVRTDSKWKMTK